MEFGSLTAILLAMAFIVPGYIFQSVAAIERRAVDGPQHKQLLNWFVLSLVCHAVSLPILIVVTGGTLVPGTEGSLLLIWAIAIVGVPGMLGLLSAHVGRKNWARKVLSAVGLRPLHPSPTAWDFAFSRCAVEHAVEVERMDGTRVRGRFGMNSLASSDPSNMDIYLETEYGYGPADDWTPIDYNEGVLIPAGQVKALRFFRIQPPGGANDRAGQERSEAVERGVSAIEKGVPTDEQAARRLPTE